MPFNRVAIGEEEWVPHEMDACREDGGGYGMVDAVLHGEPTV